MNACSSLLQKYFFCEPFWSLECLITPSSLKRQEQKEIGQGTSTRLPSLLTSSLVFTLSTSANCPDRQLCFQEASLHRFSLQRTGRSFKGRWQQITGSGFKHKTIENSLRSAFCIWSLALFNLAYSVTLENILILVSAGILQTFRLPPARVCADPYEKPLQTCIYFNGQQRATAVVLIVMEFQGKMSPAWLDLWS